MERELGCGTHLNGISSKPHHFCPQCPVAHKDENSAASGAASHEWDIFQAHPTFETAGSSM